MTDSQRQRRESQGTVSRNAVLLSLAGAIGIQIPLSIQQVPDPTIRALLQVGVLIIVVTLSIKVIPREQIPKEPQSFDEKKGADRTTIRPPASR